MSGCATTASPVAGPAPVRMDSTPGGSTSATSSPRRSADSGVWCGALSSTQLPATSGAAILPAANMIGWLYGMIRATTPIGCSVV